ncbi:HAD hydrolase-like protein [Actinoplanes aureus]|uniref:HAD hydrolase-like protein n=1 Tax=Actinoplanes aureus TaxID=2792083 RepID=A0A931FVL8_9ACTN|nr:HAD hydrolase-like protein [Actinoplanes aureus]MBG0561463.1 HAD hydrolase-like protein [Actinoplanes aureus]
MIDTIFFDVPSSIRYVGDRPDNDVRPAEDAGMKTCLIRRGGACSAAKHNAASG